MSKARCRGDESDRPTIFEDAVLKPSIRLPTGVNTHVRGYDFNQGVDYEALLNSFAVTGFQATHFGRAVDVINEMLKKRFDSPVVDGEEEACFRDDYDRPTPPCTLFLAYTSNMVSCGVRDTIRFLVQHKLVDVLVTSAGGVEEDILKCFGHFFVGDFTKYPGQELRALGINRIGNLLVPNDHYVKLESWMMPILDQVLEEQNANNINWTPSKLIDRLGKEINNDESIYYWCHVNQIPVFCPGFTDGALGDILFSHTYRSPGLRVDIVEDIRRINRLAIFAKSTGMIVLGGGIVKHHTFNANLMRNGADFTVLVNTGNEFDGSDSGAQPDEAVSWGKIRGSSEPVKIFADASFVFPLLVAMTFAKRVNKD